MTARLELTWPNKEKFLLTPRDDAGKPVWVGRDHPAAREVRLTEFTAAVGDVNDDDPYADNLLFVGDSLDALRVLNNVPEYRRHYRGKVKLAYWDPPFNTGQTFIHYDDWMEHSTWLSFMRERLLIARDLLAPDGSIWIHLDDVEAHRMRSAMDEVFGADNFVATVAWEKVYSPRMDAKQFSSSHDTILIYSRTPGWRPNPFTIEPDPTQFRHVDQHGRAFRSDPLRKWGKNSAREDRPNLWYPIEAPDGTVVWPIKPDGKEGNWRWQRETYEANKDAVDWLDKGNGLQPYLRQYADTSTTRPPETLWRSTDVGHNQEGKTEVKTLFPDATPFATPKPERLLERVLHIGTSAGDIVLDCFGGSGTTAAVAHKMGRRWVTSELSSDTAVTFTLPRLRKVIAGEDPGGITTSERIEAVGDLPDGVTAQQAKAAVSVLNALAEHGTFDDLGLLDVANKYGTFTFKKTATPEEADEQRRAAQDAMVKRFVGAVRKAARTKAVVTKDWSGGGGCRVVEVGPSMYEVTPYGTALAEWATNGRFARAVAGQLGFEWQDGRHAPFCAVRGRMRLAVFDGAVGEEEVRQIIAALDEKERVTIVAKVVLPGAEDLLTKESRGSRIRKAPRDILTDRAGARRAQKEEAR